MGVLAAPRRGGGFDDAFTQRKMLAARGGSSGELFCVRGVAAESCFCGEVFPGGSLGQRWLMHGPRCPAGALGISRVGGGRLRVRCVGCLC